MDKVLHEQPIGEEAKLKIEVKDGNVVLTLGLDTKGADVSVAVKLESGYFLDKLAEAIPGELDDSVLSILKGALKS